MTTSLAILEDGHEVSSRSIKDLPETIECQCKEKCGIVIHLDKKDAAALFHVHWGRIVSVDCPNQGQRRGERLPPKGRNFYRRPY